MTSRQPRKPGVKPAPRYRFDPSYIRHVRASGLSVGTLALVCGFPSITVLSPLLHRRAVVATPLTVARLERLAEVVKYTGPIFVEGTECEAVRS